MIRLFSTTAPSPALPMNTPESMRSRLWPELRISRSRITTSGAETRITFPRRPPSTTAPGRPDKVMVLSMSIGPS